MKPKGSGKNHTPLKPPEDSSPTYNKMEDISSRIEGIDEGYKTYIFILHVSTQKEYIEEKRDLF